MSRAIHRLRGGRVDKIIRKLRARHLKIPDTFVHDHYKNIAAYGKFNTIEETNHIVRLYEEKHMNNQAQGTTKAAEPSITDLERELTNAINQHTANVKDHERSKEEAARWNEAVFMAQLKVDDASIALGKAKLGKAKLAEAITLIEDVNKNAPKGSAAAKDIAGLTERLMLSRMHSVLGSMTHDSIFVAPRPAQGKTDFAHSFKYPDTKALRSSTAEAIANMQTNVGAGQPRQAKPSPVQYKVGDKVRMLKSWYNDGVKWIGKILTIKAISNGFLYFEELGEANCYSDKGFFSEPLVGIQVGDTVRKKNPLPVFTRCDATGELTVVEAGAYTRVAELVGSFDVRAFELVHRPA